MNKRFEVLDSFRGLAAIFIIVHHLDYSGSITDWTFFTDAQLFVDMFFILSGFVLAHSYAFKDNLDFKSFFISRTFRIFPLHIFILTLFVLSELLHYFAYQYGLLSHTLAFTGHNLPEHLPAYYLLLQSWIPSVSIVGFNPPSWSISVEYYMYMIFFITIWFTKEKRNILWAFISIGSFGLLVNTSMDIGNMIYVVRGLSSFFLGALVYILYKRYRHKMNKLSVMYYSLFEVLILLSIIYMVSSNQPYKSILICFLFAIQIFIFAFERGYISNFLKQKVFLHIGQLSYSIYLIHYFLFLVIKFGLDMIKKLGFPIIDMINANPIYGNIVVLFTIFIVIYISGYTYKYIELKWQNIGKKLK